MGKPAVLTTHGTRRASSVMLIQPHDGGKEGQIDFAACVHCGRHWPVGASIAGIVTGKIELGFCAKCNGIHCPGCQECWTVEQRLEDMERLIVGA